MLRILLVALALSLGVFYAKQERVLYRAGVLGSCQVVASPVSGDRGQWWSCREGIFTGFPQLALDHCDRQGRVGAREVWRCPTPLKQSPVVV